MKKMFTQCSFILSLLIAISTGVNAQDVYWREGFDQGTTDLPSSATDPRNLAGYYATLPSGSWYIFGAYRTTGTNCVNYGTGHIRTMSTSQGLVNPDSAKVVSPVLDFGASEFHFSRCRASRNYGIYYRTDTAGSSAAGWVLVTNVRSSPNTSSDTTIIVNQPSARRMMITGDIDNALNNSNQDFDSIWIVSSTPIVPVKFNGVNASYANNVVKVSWSNETEINTQSYQIERSNDGIHFVTVGLVNAINTRQYSWFDYSPVSGNSFYRIKGVDKDGKLSYSSIVKLNFTNKLPQVAITPNPVKDGKLNVQLNNLEKGNYTLIMSNRAGQIVLNQTIKYIGGNSTEAIILPASVSKGYYDVQIKNTTKTFTKTVLVQ